jgi:hypothetical protein
MGASGLEYGGELKSAVLRTGSIFDTPPLEGSCRAPFRSLLVTAENTGVAGRRELMSYRVPL